MTTFLFDLPVELRSTIFETLSLRDISRLRQCCSAWKNNLQDLSFLKVLDFSYSPDIAVDTFNYLLNNRINKAQNSVTKVILAHTRYLNKSSLEELFRVLPRIKDIRIRYSLTSECIPVLLKQENLECMSYRNDAKSLSKADAIELKCTKLTRFKMDETMREIQWDPELKLKLLKMNPALRNDFDFLKFLAGGLVEYINGYPELWDLIFSSNDLRIHKRFWRSVANFRLFEFMAKEPISMGQIFDRTTKLLFDLSDEQRKESNTTLALGDMLFEAIESFTDLGAKLNDQQIDLLRELSELFNNSANDPNLLEKDLNKFKKRPFHRQAREYFLQTKIGEINRLVRRGDTRSQYEEELNKLIEVVGSIMKRMPRRIRLMRAPLYLHKGKIQEAFEEYFGIIDPRYRLKMQAELYDDKNAQAIFGAYHVAKDYLKNPELLQRLEALNRDNYKIIRNHFATIQETFDEGTCTRKVTGNNFMKQYWYACYTCNLTGAFNGLCYACTKSCHANHEIAYLRLGECYCDCTKCPYGSTAEGSSPTLVSSFPTYAQPHPNF